MQLAMRTALGFLVVVLSATNVPAQPSAKDRLTVSVDRALAFLASKQQNDGAWDSNGQKHPAITSLAVMAFLSAGHVPGEGPYKANVEKGIRWVLSQIDKKGSVANSAPGEMYHVGICAMMLAEVVAMSDAKAAEQIRPKLEACVKRILLAQRLEKGIHRGGWRYGVEGADADLSITGWQLLALRAARNIGCDVPAERIDLAIGFVMECRNPRTGAFTYMAGSEGDTKACTGTGILALELCGKDRHLSREALRAGSYLLKTPLSNNEQYHYYTFYYASQAMFQLGNNYWLAFRPNLHKVLLGSQQKDGSWLDLDGLGVAYPTAMSVLALTVEYRLLPIYQRNEEGEKK